MEVKTLENRPDAALTAELVMMLNHYTTLCRYRPSSMASTPCAVPLTQIEAYHRIHGIEEYMSLEEFSHWMMELDGELIAHYTREAEREKAKK